MRHNELEGRSSIFLTDYTGITFLSESPFVSLTVLDMGYHAIVLLSMRSCEDDEKRRRGKSSRSVEQHQAQKVEN